MANVDRAYNLVRNELAEVGLLDDGIYLDTVELCISDQKSGGGEWGYVFERVGHYAKLGYRPGVIYLPRDLPHRPYTPGLTLTDTIRHEYAHAWFYIDPSFFRQGWFVRTFGAAYSNLEPIPYLQWQRKVFKNLLDVSTKKASKRKRSSSEATRHEFHERTMLRYFVSEYATTNASEDFAETFMFFLKYRRSLDRFAKRPIVYKKLKMVERAIAMAARRVRSRQVHPRSLRSRSA
jgi:hypothetical protein